MSGARIIGFVIRSVLMGMIAAIFLFIFFPELLKPITAPKPVVEQPTEVMSYADAIEKVSESVVNIRTFSIDQEVWYPNRARVRVRGGSGVIISDQGYIVTNYHVIADAEELTIELKDGRTAIAQLIAYDEATDLAVLKINLDNLPYTIMNSAIRSRMGDVVFAVGYPFGGGQVATMGIVSPSASQFRIAEFEDYVLSDATTFPGNSGGALINANGDLLGIISSRLSTQGISLAISTKLAMDVVEQLVANGRVIRGWLGFSGGPLGLAGQERYGEFSYIIDAITPGGPAEAAGLQVNDVITSIDGQEAATAIDLRYLIASYKPGKVLDLEIIRNDEKLHVQITVAERPDDQNKSLSTLNR
jgi:serine protease DegS